MDWRLPKKDFGLQGRRDVALWNSGRLETLDRLKGIRVSEFHGESNRSEMLLFLCAANELVGEMQEADRQCWWHCTLPLLR